MALQTQARRIWPVGPPLRGPGCRSRELTLPMLTRRWFPVALLIGAVYASIGILFALPAGPVKFWRWAAWAVSAAFYTAHICFEHLRLRNRPVRAAAHVAVAAALGALGLAVAANIHSLVAGDSGQHRRLMMLALVLWPAITALPAFLIAWAASALLGQLSRPR